MNDTTRDELRENVADAFRAFAGEMGGGEDWSQAYYDHADRTIALVTAARDAEIREALLGEESRAVNVAAEVIGHHDGMYPEGGMFYFEIAEDVVTALAAYIGLHGDGRGAHQ